MTFIFGFFAIAFGVVLIIFTEWFLNNFGRIAWAEEHLGDSRLFYKLLGIIFILLAFFAMTGILSKIILGIFGSLFVGLQ